MVEQRALEDDSRAGSRGQLQPSLCLLDAQSGEIVEESRLRVPHRGGLPEVFRQRFETPSTSG
jgi:hypothetical protein